MTKTLKQHNEETLKAYRHALFAAIIQIENDLEEEQEGS